MKVNKRRRLEGKTNYLKRRKLLESYKPRVVLRKTNRYIILQFVKSNQARDFVKLTVNSKILLKYGWPKNLQGSLKSISAAYLIGFLFGKEIQKLEKERNLIIDTGLIRSTKGSKIYSAIKGIIDSGIELNCKKEMFPKEDRILGKHMKEDFSSRFEDIKNKIAGGEK